MVAILHAFTTMYLAVKLSFMARPLEIGGENTPGQTTVVNVAGGFFLYDIVSWIIYGYMIDKCVFGRVCLLFGGQSHSICTHARLSNQPNQRRPNPPHSNRYDYAQLFHHGACLIGMWACWATGRSGADCTFALFIAELANPFMYLRYLLREVGWHSTPLARTNQVRGRLGCLGCGVCFRWRRMD